MHSVLKNTSKAPGTMVPQLKDKYRQQLKDGCNQTACYGVFCRSGLETGVVENVSEMLSWYGDMFLCEGIHKVLEHGCIYNSNSEQKNRLLEFFFGLNARIFNSGRIGPEKSVESVQLDDGELTTPYLGRNKEAGSTKSRGTVEGSEWVKKKVRRNNMQGSGGEVENRVEGLRIDTIPENETRTLDHEICHMLSRKGLSEEDMYILTEMARLLLRKYEGLPHFALGMTIIRIYCLVSRHRDFEHSCYSILYKIFCNIHSLCGETLKKTQLSEGVACKGIRTSQGRGSICIHCPRFTKTDLVTAVESVSRTLNTSETTDNREDKKIDSLLKMFHLLYLINEECGLLSYKKFYLGGFCSRMSFREEFRHFRTKTKTPLNFPFILPIHIKAELIKYENNDKMKTSLQDSFFKSLFEGHVDPYLFITVDRETIYEDSIEIFKKLRTEDAKKQLRITFKNEEGIDSGGIRKEYFQLLSQEIKEDERLFETTENRVWIKPGDGDEESYEAIGKIIAIALYNNVVLNIPFPSVFFKKLLGRRCSVEDLKEISIDIATSLRNLRRLAKDEIDALGFNFVIEYNVDGAARTHVLMKGGENTKLTAENMRLFIEKYADFYTNVLIERQFEAVKRGFYSIIDKATITYLDPRELEKIMMGSNAFDMEAIKSTATYSGFKDNSLVITYFWEIFEKFDRRKKKKLLQFITGNDRIPVSGSASLKLVIMRNGCDTDRLPSSQTCFNTLLLPEYSSKDKLERKLETALELTAGFFLL